LLVFVLTLMRTTSTTCASRIWCLSRVGIVLFFFFSSRRRHTRSKRDWSSDVCSSDLSSDKHRHLSVDKRSAVKPAFIRRGSLGRSEERRVGKECRSRWSRDHEKKKKEGKKEEHRGGRKTDRTEDEGEWRTADRR